MSDIPYLFNPYTAAFGAAKWFAWEKAGLPSVHAHYGKGRNAEKGEYPVHFGPVDTGYHYSYVPHNKFWNDPITGLSKFTDFRKNKNADAGMEKVRGVWRRKKPSTLSTMPVVKVSYHNCYKMQFDRDTYRVATRIGKRAKEAGRSAGRRAFNGMRNALMPRAYSSARVLRNGPGQPVSFTRCTQLGFMSLGLNTAVGPGAVVPTGMTVIPGTIANGQCNTQFKFKLSDINTSDLVDCYGAFKLNSVTIHLGPLYDPGSISDASGPLATQANLCVATFASDPLGGAVAACGAYSLSEYSNFKTGFISSANPWISYTCYPKMVGVATNAANTSINVVSNTTNSFLTLDSSGITAIFNDLRVGLETRATGSNGIFQYYFTYNFTCIRSR